MQISQNWRELLGKMIYDPQDRQQIANALGVSSVTLIRWANGSSKPRTQNLRQLMALFPEYRQIFLSLLPEEFGHDIAKKIDISILPQDIPAEFYARVIHAYRTLPRMFRCKSICELVLKQAAPHIDPYKTDVYFSVLQCQKPASPQSPVRSLRVVFDITSSHAPTYPILMGAGTVGGTVVTTGNTVILCKEQTGPLKRDVWQRWARCAVGYPIKMANRIAGALVVAGPDTNYLLHPARLRLLQQYAELVALAFEPEDYYASEQIDLAPLPPFEVQILIFSH